MAMFKYLILVSLIHMGTCKATSAAEAEELMVENDVLSSFVHHLKYADPAVLENHEGPAGDILGQFVRDVNPRTKTTLCEGCIVRELLLLLYLSLINNL